MLTRVNSSEKKGLCSIFFVVVILVALFSMISAKSGLFSFSSWMSCSIQMLQWGLSFLCSADVDILFDYGWKNPPDLTVFTVALIVHLDGREKHVFFFLLIMNLQAFSLLLSANRTICAHSTDSVEAVDLPGMCCFFFPQEGKGTESISKTQPFFPFLVPQTVSDPSVAPPPCFSPSLGCAHAEGLSIHFRWVMLWDLTLALCRKTAQLDVCRRTLQC